MSADIYNLMEVCDRASKGVGDGPINLRKFHNASGLYLAIKAGASWLLRNGYQNLVRDLRDFMSKELGDDPR